MDIGLIGVVLKDLLHQVFKADRAVGGAHGLQGGGVTTGLGNHHEQVDVGVGGHEAVRPVVIGIQNLQAVLHDVVLAFFTVLKEFKHFGLRHPVDVHHDGFGVLAAGGDAGGDTDRVRLIVVQGLAGRHAGAGVQDRQLGVRAVLHQGGNHVAVGGEIETVHAGLAVDEVRLGLAAVGVQREFLGDQALVVHGVQGLIVPLDGLPVQGNDLQVAVDGDFAGIGVAGAVGIGAHAGGAGQLLGRGDGVIAAEVRVTEGAQHIQVFLNGFGHFLADLLQPVGADHGRPVVRIVTGSREVHLHLLAADVVFAGVVGVFPDIGQIIGHIFPDHVLVDLLHEFLVDIGQQLGVVVVENHVRRGLVGPHLEGEVIDFVGTGNRHIGDLDVVLVAEVLLYPVGPPVVFDGILDAVALIDRDFQLDLLAVGDDFGAGRGVLHLVLSQSRDAHHGQSHDQR